MSGPSVKIEDYIGRAVSTLKEKKKDTYEAFNGLLNSVHKEGALSIKVKELISLGIAIVVRCEPCIAYHVKGSLEAGATEMEIIETVATAILMGGGPALSYSGYAIKCLKEFGK